jgi:hypothetical protein
MKTSTIVDLPWLVAMVGPFRHRDLPGPFELTWRTGPNNEHKIAKVVCLTTGKEVSIGTEAI